MVGLGVFHYVVGEKDVSGTDGGVVDRSRKMAMAVPACTLLVSKPFYDRVGLGHWQHACLKTLHTLHVSVCLALASHTLGSLDHGSTLPLQRSI